MFLFITLRKVGDMEKLPFTGAIRYPPMYLADAGRRLADGQTGASNHGRRGRRALRLPGLGTRQVPAKLPTLAADEVEVGEVRRPERPVKGEAAHLRLRRLQKKSGHETNHVARDAEKAEKAAQKAAEKPAKQAAK